MSESMKGKVSWLQEHLRDFVYTRIHESLIRMHYDSCPRYFTPEEMAVIKNIWRSVKKAATGKLLILPGRDVFVFEVLARREGFPTLFLPACSRQTVKWYKDRIPSNSFIQILDLWERYLTV